MSPNGRFHGFVSIVTVIGFVITPLHLPAAVPAMQTGSETQPVAVQPDPGYHPSISREAPDFPLTPPDVSATSWSAPQLARKLALSESRLEPALWMPSGDQGGVKNLPNEDSAAQPAFPETVYISGTIASDTTWTAANSPYVIDGALTVLQGVTLTVEAGVVVKFDLVEVLNVYGSLVAAGTLVNPVIFTSLRDDSAGGDTNGDGNATLPVRGDWGSIFVSSDGSRAQFTYSEIRYGGYYYGGLTVVGGTSLVQPVSVLATESVFRENAGAGIYVIGGDCDVEISNSLVSDNSLVGVYAAQANLLLANSEVIGNGEDGVRVEGEAMRLEVDSSTISGNTQDGIEAGHALTVTNSTISGNGEDGIEIVPTYGEVQSLVSNNAILNNTRDGIYVRYNQAYGLPSLSGNTLSGNGLDGGIGLGGTLEGNMILPQQAFPGLGYVIQNLQINSAAELTVTAGTILKFDQYNSLYVYGRLQAQGAAGSEVIFTSLRDDSAGGDTNGDGNATQPAPGDWDTISAGWDGAQVVLEHADIRYGGYSNAALSAWSFYAPVSVNVLSSTIHENASSGIYASGTQVSLELTGSELSGNASHGIHITGGRAMLAGCTVDSNGMDGILAEGSSARLQVTDCLVSGNTQDGIEAGHVVTVTNSTISLNGEDGLEVRPTYGMASVQISGNSILDNARDAVFVDFIYGGGLPQMSGNTLSGNGLNNGISLGGVIGISTTLPADPYPGLTYVVRDLQVESAADLTVDPGSVVKFGAGGVLYVFGDLYALGTPGNEIIFTSLRDDSAGGDTNGDGSATIPASGDWGTIQLGWDGVEASFDHAELRFGGSSYAGLTVFGWSWTQPVTVTFANSLVRDSQQHGIYVSGDPVTLQLESSILQDNQGSGIYTWYGHVQVSGSTFSGNGEDGIHVDGENASLEVSGSTVSSNIQDGIEAGDLLTVTNSTISLNGEDGVEQRPYLMLGQALISGNTIDSNGRYALYMNYNGGAGFPSFTGNTISGNRLDHGVALGGMIGISATLPVQAYPGMTYVLYDLNVDGGTVLRITPGTILKIEPNSALYVFGDLIAQGMPGNEIVFTSLLDDSIGGDTNGDGTATLPAPGDWARLHIGYNGSGSNLEYVTVRYSGSAGAAVDKWNWGGSAVDLTIRHSAIYSNTNIGLSVQGQGTVTVIDTLLAENHQGAYASGSTLRIIDSRIVDNSFSGVSIWQADVEVSGSTISGNASFGINNFTNLPVVQATDNWWGHASGPQHPVSNPTGLGDAVSDFVVYDAWRVSPTTRTALPLMVGQVVTATVGPLDYVDFILPVSAGETLVARITPLDGSNALWTFSRFGDFPLWGLYDQRTQQPGSHGYYELLLAPTQTGENYFSVYGRDVTLNGGQFRIVVTSLPTNYLSEVSPGSAGNAGEITLELRGLPFEPGMGAELRLAASPPIQAYTLTVSSPTSLWATFDLNGAQTGLYDLYALWPDNSEAGLTEAFTVTSGSGPLLQARLVLPPVARLSRDTDFTIEYTNVGDADLPEPAFVITATDSINMSLATSYPYITGSLQVLGSSQDSSLGVLRPGAIHYMRVHFNPSRAGQARVRLVRIVSEPVSTIDWAAIGAESKPPEMGQALWDAIWENFTATIGDTWDDYQGWLSAQSSYLRSHGYFRFFILATCLMGCYQSDWSISANTQEMLSGAMARAAGSYPLRTLAQSLDASAPGRGLPLAFTRTSFNSLHQRFTPGPFGRSWSHSYEYSLSQPAAGTIVIHGPGGAGRQFKLNWAGDWQGAAGDRASLTQQADGSFRLQETDGLTWVFSPAGRFDYIEEPNGNRVTMGYDSAGRLTTIAHSNGQSFSLAYNAQGRISQLTDHTGQVTQYTYDASGQRLLSVLAPGGVTTSYAYVAPGGRTNDDYALSSATFPDGSHQYYSYDAQGRISAQWRDGNAERTSYAYDRYGTVYMRDADNALTALYLGPRGELLELQDPLGGITRLLYDWSFRLVRIIAPDATATGLRYDSLGNVTQTTDPLNNTVRLGYTTRYSRLDWLLDARGSLTDITSDARGNLTSVIYPDASLETFSYDSPGSLVAATNRRQQVVDFTYNSIGQLTRKTYPDGRTVDYSYDARGNLVSAQDSLTSAITLQYDARNFLTRIDYPDGGWFTFEYNQGGARTRRTSHDGFVLNYEYDAVGRLSRLANGTNATIVQYQYDSVGRLSREDKGNGTYTTYAYDAANQLLSLVNHAPGGAEQSRFDYSYDINGNRTSMTTLDGTTFYRYDPAGQLTGVTYPDGRQVGYQYDANGNRTAVIDDGLTTSYTSNQLNQYTHVGGETFTYDADGNMISKSGASGTTTYQYDYENRLIQVSHPISGTWQYAYDAFGNRSSVTYNGVTTHFVHDPIGMVDVAAEYDMGGALVARYVHALGLVSRIDGADNSAYYAYDAYGNTRQITDAGGNIRNEYDYDPFGKVRRVIDNIPNQFLFVGRFGVADSSPDLYFMRARFYSPDLGRFLSVDPFGIVGDQVNLYTYVSNNPLSGVDPLGLQSREDIYRDLSFGGDIMGLGYELGRRLVSDPSHYWYWRWTRGIAPFQHNRMINFWNGPMGALANGAGALLAIPEAIDSWRQYAETASGFIRGEASQLDLIHDSAVAVWNSTLGWALPLGGTLGELADWLPTQFVDSGTINVLTAMDPNEKVGPLGAGPQRVVRAIDELPYTINFENVMTATAPAQEVFITDYLDPDLDWKSLRFTGAGFGDQQLSIDSDDYQLSTRLTVPDYRPEVTRTWWLDVYAQVNPFNGRVDWRFRTLDPLTGDLPSDPLAGFLPPEDGSGRGQGFVSYALYPRQEVPLGTVITNTASIIFDVNEPIITSQVWNTIGLVADLALEQSAEPPSVQVGESITYTLSLANHGPDVTGSVTLTDSLPAGVSLLSASPGQGECGQTIPLNCQLGDLASGDGVTVTIVVAAQLPGEQVNHVQVSSTSADPDNADNASSVSVLVEALEEQADLSLSLTDFPDPIETGSLLTYTLQVTNHGPDIAAAVLLTDSLPVAAQFQSSIPPAPECELEDRLVTCLLGDLAAGGQRTITLFVTPLQAGELLNLAAVSSQSVDPNPLDNRAQQVTQVLPALRKVFLPLVRRQVY